MTDYDPVSRPSHYAQGREYEPIDVIEDWELGFHEANAVKYISRSGRKDNQIQDLEKAVWYLERRISQLKDGETENMGATADRIIADETGDSITIDKAKGIASDGFDVEAYAELVLSGFQELHRTGRMARNSTGSYL